MIGEDLDWFWTSWFYNTWTLDHSIHSVSQDSVYTIIEIEDMGLLPMPVHMEIFTEDGGRIFEKINQSHWLDGKRFATLKIPRKDIRKVILDPEHKMPDLNRLNDIWTKQ